MPRQKVLQTVAKSSGIIDRSSRRLEGMFTVELLALACELEDYASSLNVQGEERKYLQGLADRCEKFRKATLRFHILEQAEIFNDELLAALPVAEGIQ